MRFEALAYITGCSTLLFDVNAPKRTPGVFLWVLPIITTLLKLLSSRRGKGRQEFFSLDTILSV